MASVDLRFFWKCEQPLFDRVEDEVVAGERPASCSRTTVEQRVAAENDALGWHVKAATSG